MAKDIRLPQLGQTMEEGTIVTILVKEGDQVKKGDVVFEIETDKATLEMESPEGGFVKKILIETGQTVPVGTALAVLGEKDEQVPQSFIHSLTAGSDAGSKGPVQDSKTVAKATEAKSDVVDSAEPDASGRVPASPKAKMLARKLGVDISSVSPAAGASRIVEADVRKVAEAMKSSAEKGSQRTYELGQKISLTRFQRITAEKMLQSKTEIPCFYLSVRADVTEMVKLRTELNQKGGVKVSYNDFIIKAVALGLRQFPEMTGKWEDEEVHLAKNINIGLAMVVEGGLVAPLIKDADTKTLSDIAKYSSELIGRARTHKLSIDDLEGGCITVSNLGSLGVESFIPIVVPGQCSILGIGKIIDTCVPLKKDILIRKMMNMTLSVDHRIVNGAYAARFLDFSKKLLEDPRTL